ncbi:three-helix bundle dimerization domain-containing protein [Micrococcus sp.]|uniref:three-helix bundle dimerization domain-containing protein n=1 Tax=Micrococcus sp. TaxID=1271 RepID=UPI002A913494|nr:hypothetical protein [Micrococcus sp.]MDY6054989.1 hypothetical protein [Micrococcus sp.]
MSIQHTDHHLPATLSPLMERRVLARVEDTLARRFAGALSAETVRATLRETVADLKAGARMTTFLPALAQHQAGERLETLAHGTHEVPAAA